VKRKEIRGVSEEVMRHLMNYDYPGNIRELQNIIEHAFVLCQGAVIGVNNLPLNLVHQISIFNKKHKATGMLLDNECRIIRETLMRHGEDRNAAARELGISRSTLWRKMKKINLNFYGSSH
jgi:transcriptional regulator with PAS, ATPase and Fis domain